MKAGLRQAMLARRAALPPDAAEALALQAQQRVAALPAFAAAGTVLLYAAFRAEVATAWLAARAPAAAKRVAYPRVLPGGELELVLVERLDSDLTPGAYGISEPRRGLPVVAPGAVDLAVVPGVAFDRAGYRLGYGGGYYDRLLPRLTRAVTVGLAYAFQVVAAVPRTATDVPVHVVVTDAEVLGPAAEV